MSVSQPLLSTVQAPPASQPAQNPVNPVEVHVETHADAAPGEAAAPYELQTVVPFVPASCCSTQWLHSVLWRPVMQLHRSHLPLVSTPPQLQHMPQQWSAFVTSVNTTVIKPRMENALPLVRQINQNLWVAPFLFIFCLVLPFFIAVFFVLILLWCLNKSAAKRNALLKMLDTRLQQCPAEFELQRQRLLQQHGLPLDLDVQLRFVEWTPAHTWSTKCALPRFLSDEARAQTPQPMPKWSPSGPRGCAALVLVVGGGQQQPVASGAPVAYVPQQPPVAFGQAQPQGPLIRVAAPVDVNPYAAYQQPQPQHQHQQPQPQPQHQPPQQYQPQQQYQQQPPVASAPPAFTAGTGAAIN